LWPTRYIGYVDDMNKNNENSTVPTLLRMQAYDCITFTRVRK